MASAICPTAACSPARACWLRAWDRAKAEQLIPYRETPTTWSVKTYTVTVTGPGWSDLSCDCAARTICKHMAVVAKCIALHVSPIRGSAPGEGYETTHEPDIRYQVDPQDEPDPCHARQRAITLERGVLSALTEEHNRHSCAAIAGFFAGVVDKMRADGELCTRCDAAVATAGGLCLACSDAPVPATWLPSGATEGFVRLSVASPLDAMWG